MRGAIHSAAVRFREIVLKFGTQKSQCHGFKPFPHAHKLKIGGRVILLDKPISYCWLMLVDVGWCWLMLADVGWCWLMLVDVGWCWLMLVDVGWCWLMLVDVGWCWLMLSTPTFQPCIGYYNRLKLPLLLVPFCKVHSFFPMVFPFRSISKLSNVFAQKQESRDQNSLYLTVILLLKSLKSPVLCWITQVTSLYRPPFSSFKLKPFT